MIWTDYFNDYDLHAHHAYGHAHHDGDYRENGRGYDHVYLSHDGVDVHHDYDRVQEIGMLLKTNQFLKTRPPSSFY